MVIFAIGGNDIDSATDHALLVGMRVFEFAKSLVSGGVERVVVTQVVRRQSFRHHPLPRVPVEYLKLTISSPRCVLLSISAFGGIRGCGSRL